MLSERIIETPTTRLQQEDQDRIYLYHLLANCLGQEASSTLIQLLSAHGQQEKSPTSEIAQALDELGQVAQQISSPEAYTELNTAFFDLFIGLGRGQLVPYTSWYMTGTLMETPLAELRSDLAKLGYRSSNQQTPEDHIAAICEVMALMIHDEHPFAVQKHFFNLHLKNWVERFFDDLTTVANCHPFYLRVGQLGRLFFAVEAKYFTINH